MTYAPNLTYAPTFTPERSDPLNGAACKGKAELFESRHIADHFKARDLCATCPVFAACDELRKEQQWQEGTWAGRLYIVGRLVPDRCANGHERTRMDTYLRGRQVVCRVCQRERNQRKEVAA